MPRCLMVVASLSAMAYLLQNIHNRERVGRDTDHGVSLDTQTSAVCLLFIYLKIFIYLSIHVNDQKNLKKNISRTQFSSVG